jgi:hypothetical protein
MKVVNGFPKGTAKNADFISGRSKPGRVLHTQRDLGNMPPLGWLCIHEDTVKQMVVKLGWKLENDDELAVALMEADELKVQIERLKDVVCRMQIAGFSDPTPDLPEIEVLETVPA